MAIKSFKAVAVCCLIMIASFVSCSLKTYKLQNGRTKVPVDTAVFTKRRLFHESMLRLIDTGAIYEEYNRRYGTLQRLDTHIETSMYGVFKFYGNGCFNDFTIDRNESFSTIQLDPYHNGHQGVYYLENGNIRIQFCGTVDQRGGAGLLYSTIRISGDTLFEKRDDLPYEHIYIKRVLPDNFLVYKAYW